MGSLGDVLVLGGCFARLSYTRLLERPASLTRRLLAKGEGLSVAAPGARAERALVLIFLLKNFAAPDAAPGTRNCALMQFGIVAPWKLHRKIKSLILSVVLWRELALPPQGELREWKSMEFIQIPLLSFQFNPSALIIRIRE